MSTSTRIFTYFIVLMWGAIIAMMIQEGRGRDPQSQRAEGRSEGYQQGVKDCMTGRAKVEIKADTLVTFP